MKHIFFQSFTHDEQAQTIEIFRWTDYIQKNLWMRIWRSHSVCTNAFMINIAEFYSFYLQL